MNDLSNQNKNAVTSFFIQKDEERLEQTRFPLPPPFPFLGSLTHSDHRRSRIQKLVPLPLRRPWQ